MRKFHVLTNLEKDIDFKITRRIVEYLTLKGCSCSVQGAVHKGELKTDNMNVSANGSDGINMVKDTPEDCDCVIVLGGDGTMIQAADLIGGRKPIIGVNLGTLGFLQEVEASDVEDMLNHLINNDYEIERRMMLRGTDGSDSYTALNDVVISRRGSLKILYLDIYVNNRKLSSYKADGIVISTPTGSTAYNLSAGGPIVEPSAEAILLTPICPHNLGARTIVLSPEDVIRVEVVPGRGEAEATFDGGAQIPLSSDGSIEIVKADIVTEIIKIGKENFIEVLSRKMN